MESCRKPRRPTMGPAADPELVDVRAEGHDSEAVFDAPGADPRVSGSLRGSPDTKSSFGRTRPRSCRSLALLRLRHGRRSGDADARSLDVDGSDPPSRHASIGTGEDGAEQPDGQAVGQRVLRRLEAARDTLPGRIAGAGATRRGRGRGAQAHLAPNPYQALGLGGRSHHGPRGQCATGDRAALPQDVVAFTDRRGPRCASLEGRSAHRHPASIAHSRTVVS